MKLIIQIPCYNEEKTLGITMDCLPRSIQGIDCIEYLIIDDGSTDETVDVARKHGAHHIISNRRNRGLARAFMLGIDACILRGADVIVNTDGDNQYNADDIEKLVEPILSGQAEIVVGARPIDSIAHWSLMKKLLQKIGSAVVRMASGTTIADAPSGFRAISREAALHINVFDNYTYTLETIIQAGRKNIPIISVPIRTNKDLRPSRLMTSIFHYVWRSLLTTTKIFMTYRPFRFFAIPGVISVLLGFIPTIRFFYYYSIGHGSGHIQSLIYSTLLIGTGAFFFLLGFIAELIGINRQLLEDIRARLRALELRKASADKDEK